MAKEDTRETLRFCVLLERGEYRWSALWETKQIRKNLGFVLIDFEEAISVF